MEVCWTCVPRSLGLRTVLKSVPFFEIVGTARLAVSRASRRWSSTGCPGPRRWAAIASPLLQATSRGAHRKPRIGWRWQHSAACTHSTPTLRAPRRDPKSYRLVRLPAAAWPREVKARGFHTLCAVRQHRPYLRQRPPWLWLRPVMPSWTVARCTHRAAMVCQTALARGVPVRRRPRPSSPDRRRRFH